MSGPRETERQWSEIVSAMHLQCAPQSNHDTFEMGMLAAVMLGTTHLKSLQRGARERLRGVGVDADKLGTLGRQAFARSRPHPPGVTRAPLKLHSNAQWTESDNVTPFPANAGR